MVFRKAGLALIFFLWPVFVAGVALIVLAIKPEPRNTWGESAEFSQLMTGQERFSVHSTNMAGAVVYVDHETGVQYLGTEVGVCPLLDADGAPLLVAEAGE